MGRLISDLDRPARRQDLKDPLNPTKLVRWVTATSPGEFKRVYEIAQKIEHTINRTENSTRAFHIPRNLRLASQLYRTFNPAGSWEYRSKTPAVYTMDVAILDLAGDLGAVVIPEKYHAAARAHLRWKIFEELWQEEEEKPELLTHDQKLKRPSLEDLRKFHLSRVRHAVVELLISEQWVDDPESLYDKSSPDTQELSFVIEDLNKAFRKVPLGRQSHLQFSSKPGQRKMFGKKPASQGWRDPENFLNREDVRAYQAADQETREGMLVQNPVLRYLLYRAGVETQLPQP
jgi:hypothetical protein